MKDAVLRHGGLGLLVAVCLFSIRRILIEPNPGHYRVFMGAARALWKGQGAYGTDFGTGVGFYFYSPFSALFLFGPLSLLPEKIGLALFMAGSCALFVAGGWALARALSTALGGVDLARPLSLFWALSAAPMLTGIVTTKLEIAITGLVLLAAAGLISSPNRIWPGFICALITSWKFQPLPIVLLWCVMLFRIRETRGFFVGLVLGAVIALVLPFFVLPWPYLFHEQHVWLTTLREFSNRSYLDFENIFAFFRHALGLPPGPLAMRALCLLGALAAAFVVWGWMGGAKKPLSKPELISRATLLSAGLGSAYAVAFSPLGQNNALILCAPLLFWISCTLFLGIKDLWERAVLSVCLAVILAVPYSDLVPLDLRDRLHAISFKQMVLLGVACGLAWTWTRRDRAWRAGAKGTVSSRRFTL